jgi:predicted lipid-binding transport protein (Tim44 family)
MRTHRSRAERQRPDDVKCKMKREGYTDCGAPATTSHSYSFQYAMAAAGSLQNRVVQGERQTMPTVQVSTIITLIHDLLERAFKPRAARSPDSAQQHSAHGDQTVPAAATNARRHVHRCHVISASRFASAASTSLYSVAVLHMLMTAPAPVSLHFVFR